MRAYVVKYACMRVHARARCKVCIKCRATARSRRRLLKQNNNNNNNNTSKNTSKKASNRAQKKACVTYFWRGVGTNLFVCDFYTPTGRVGWLLDETESALCLSLVVIGSTSKSVLGNTSGTKKLVRWTD